MDAFSKIDEAGITEVWKDIPGYEGRYKVSNYGRIRSLSSRPTIMKQQVSHNGYNKVTLRGKTYKVHRLVWIAFNGPIPDGMECNHLNEDKTDNRLCNLELTDRKTNCNYGTRNKRISERLKNNEWSSKRVIQLNKNNEILCFYPSIQEASRETGVNVSSIYWCCSGKPVFKRKTKTGIKVYPLKSSGGFIWKYAE